MKAIASHLRQPHLGRRIREQMADIPQDEEEGSMMPGILGIEIAHHPHYQQAHQHHPAVEEFSMSVPAPAGWLDPIRHAAPHDRDEEVEGQDPIWGHDIEMIKAQYHQDKEYHTYEHMPMLSHDDGTSSGVYKSGYGVDESIGWVCRTTNIQNRKP